MTTNPQDLDALILDLRPMNGCNEFDRAVEAIESLRAENEALRRDLLAAEERGIQIGLRAAEQSLRIWQASLVYHSMSETAITVGMSADVVLILTPDEARKMGEV